MNSLINLRRLEPALLLAFKLSEARAFRVALRGVKVRVPLKNNALEVERANPSGFEEGDRFREAKPVRRVRKPKAEDADSWVVAVEGFCIFDRLERDCSDGKIRFFYGVFCSFCTYKQRTLFFFFG